MNLLCNVDQTRLTTYQCRCFPNTKRHATLSLFLSSHVSEFFFLVSLAHLYFSTFQISSTWLYFMRKSLNVIKKPINFMINVGYALILYVHLYEYRKHYNVQNISWWHRLLAINRDLKKSYLISEKYCIQCNISTNIVAYNMYKNVMRTLLLVRRNTLIIYVRVCPISKDRSKSSSPY